MKTEPIAHRPSLRPSLDPRTAVVCAAVTVLLCCLLTSAATAAPATQPASSVAGTPRGERLINAYFRTETAALAHRCLADIKTLKDWTDRRQEYRRQLAEMLGLWPEPQRTDLHATVTGKLDQPDFAVEKLHFQSRPGLYVTANLYLPKHLTGRAPAVLYVCGHANEIKNGVSYGSKAHYQYFPAWLARNGYVCLILDTLELAEITGATHHGTYYEGWWWWHSRGYTPAGVEAWNGIRALDYLCSRPEVDPNRLGVTGRSGGGATSWWVPALDERVKAAVPTSGMSDLHDQVVGNCIEGQCDCMYMVNTYRWDFAQVAALVAPRALLIGTSDADSIFPLPGVTRLHEQTKAIYHLYNADANLGLLVVPGPHQDSPDLQVPTLRWLNRFLKDLPKGDPGSLDNYAERFSEPEPLKVLSEIPKDQRNTTVQEWFVPEAPPPAVPADAAAWAKQRDEWLAGLKRQTFAGWPDEPAGHAPPLELKPAFSAAHDGIRLRALDFVSQHDVPLRLYLASRDNNDRNARPDLVVLNVLDESAWAKWVATMRVKFGDELSEEIDSAPAAPDPSAYDELAGLLHGHPWVMAYVAPRGVGPTAWAADTGAKYAQRGKRDTHIRRRFALLGQTLDGMRVWDVRRALQALRELALREAGQRREGGEPGLRGIPLWLQGERRMAGIALYASLFEPDVARLDLWELSSSHDASAGSANGPNLLNVLKVLDLPAAVALAAERSKVRLYVPKGADKSAWDYPSAVAKALHWPEGRLQVRETE